MLRFLLALALALCILAAIVILPFLLLFTVVSLQQGYSWKEMDWNEDGTTTIAEFLEATDVGKRKLVVDGRTCSEFYSLKDGLPIRLDCP